MKAWDYLVELGNTAEEVANSLRAKGIKGKKESCSSCPLANYLYLKYDFVDVDTFQFMAYNTGASYANQETQPLPLACQNFINYFDNDNYPDLVVADNACME